MAYPATTYYLSTKLNWMARKLKYLNEASAIKEWTDAMQSVFRTLEAFFREQKLINPNGDNNQEVRNPQITVY